MAIALLFAAVMVFTVAQPVAASNRYWATGQTQYRIILNQDQCSVPFNYPAKTPFYIQHGHVDGAWSSETPANKRAFMGPATYFEFRIDGVIQKSTMFAPYDPAQDLKWKFSISESDEGLNGIHVFYSAWYFDAEFIGGTPGVAVLDFSCESTVTFV